MPFAHEDFDLCSCFVQECGGFQCALSAADDGDTCAVKPCEISVFRRVGDDRGREIHKLRRTPRKGGDSCCHHHPPRFLSGTVMESQMKTGTASLDPRNSAGIDLGYNFFLEPSAVGYKFLERNGRGEFLGRRSLVCQ